MDEPDAFMLEAMRVAEERVKTENPQLYEAMCRRAARMEKKYFEMPNPWVELLKGGTFVYNDPTPFKEDSPEK